MLKLLLVYFPLVIILYKLTISARKNSFRDVKCPNYLCIFYIHYPICAGQQPSVFVGLKVLRFFVFSFLNG